MKFARTAALLVAATAGASPARAVGDRPAWLPAGQKFVCSSRAASRPLDAGGFESADTHVAGIVIAATLGAWLVVLAAAWTSRRKDTRGRST